MSKPGDDRQKDLLRPPLDEIVDLGHPLARLARRFRSVCRSGSGQRPLPTRLVAGLLILEYMHDLSDEVLRARWLENPYYRVPRTLMEMSAVLCRRLGERPPGAGLQGQASNHLMLLRSKGVVVSDEEKAA